MSFSYISRKVPQNYLCSRCGISGVKLWRQYQTFVPELFCIDCSLVDQGIKEYVFDKAPREIKWLALAVPDEEGVGYWGYTSIPEIGLLWWDRLPLRKEG